MYQNKDESKYIQSTSRNTQDHRISHCTIKRKKLLNINAFTEKKRKNKYETKERSWRGFCYKNKIQRESFPDHNE